VTVTFLLIFLTAVVAGLLVSMLGIGGAMILVPVITLFLGVPMKAAIGASIVSVVATSMAAQVVYQGRGMTNTRLGYILQIATAVGAVVGAMLAVVLGGQYLQILFGLLLLWASWAMGGRFTGRRKEAPTGLLDERFVDASNGETVSYGVRRLPLGFGLSFVAGNISGLLGVGGGAVQMPVMNLFMGIPLKAAIATSNFMIGVTAATSAAVYFGKGYVHPAVAVPSALGILVGAQIGPRIGAKMKSRTLRLLLQLLLLTFAVQMIWKAVG
jgi:uncharacterized protein